VSDAPQADDSGLAAEPTAVEADAKKTNGRLTTLGIIRGYVLLVLGVGLIIFSVIGPIHPGAMTLGGALVGFNPLFKATLAS
jgi:hypothetical protein